MMKRASCLVNPRACYETTLQITRVLSNKMMNIAVVGAGPSGLACAVTAAQRGHNVTLYDKDDKIGEYIHLSIHLFTHTIYTVYTCILCVLEVYIRIL